MRAGAVQVSVACLLAFSLGGSAVRAAESKAADALVAREYRAQVALDIDTDGKVSGIQLPQDVPAMLAAPAREAIARWRFKPPVRDGHAVTARTYVRLVLQLVRQADGNYGLRAVYRANGPRLILTQLPQYPLNELRQRGQGTIVMEAIVHPDGTLSDIHMASHRINHPGPGAFVTSAQAVMQHAHAQPELVAGQPVATRIQVPFVYALQSVSRSEALSRQEAKDGAPATAEAPQSVGEPVALDSPVQLIAGPPG